VRPLRTCALVPVYEHAASAAVVVGQLRAAGLDCIVVDDGSSAGSARQLAALAAPGTTLLRHAANRGKGAAVMTGLRGARELGYTHALQIDADGQHDVADVPRLLAAAAHHPAAVIVGYPRYDATVPRLRYYGRYATHVWVWINTLSRRIVDSMCGLRIYPVDCTVTLLDRVRLGERMEFDTEVLVRLDWAGVPMVNLPVRVRYDTGQRSHFRMWRDNLLITRMHARLFLGMLWRLGPLLARARRR
jgi:glycosyltransferase involved in cell wall biosynthesis